MRKHSYRGTAVKLLVRGKFGGMNGALVEVLDGSVGTDHGRMSVGSHVFIPRAQLRYLRLSKQLK